MLFRNFGAHESPLAPSNRWRDGWMATWLCQLAAGRDVPETMAPQQNFTHEMLFIDVYRLIMLHYMMYNLMISDVV